MDSRTSGIIEDLALAILRINDDAHSATTDKRDEQAALKLLALTLRKAVNHKPLWIELEAEATGTSQLDARAYAESLLTTISTVLGVAHADLLERCGYRSPPPPPAFILVDRTRKAVLWGDRRPRWGRRHVQAAHSELDAFVNRLETALSAGTALRKISQGAQQIGVGGLLLFLVSHVELKTGDTLGVEIGLSLKDLVKIEITVPAPWVADEQAVTAARALIVNSQISNLGETIDTVHLDGGMPEEHRVAQPNRWFVSPVGSQTEQRDRTAATVEKERRDVQAAKDEEERQRWNTEGWDSKSADHGLDDSDGYSR